MAYDDNYEERRRLADEAERRRKAERENERSRRIAEARRQGKEDAVRSLLGIVSAPGSARPAQGRPEPAAPASPLRPGPEFAEHQRALLRNLQAAARFLSFARVANWAARVERLHFAQPEAALAELKDIKDEYRCATAGRATPLAYEVDAVGLELDHLIAVLSRALYAT